MSYDDGLITGLLLGSGGGSGDDDEPLYLSDPDYALYQALPEPAENQIVGLIRVSGNGEEIYLLDITGWISENGVVYGTIDYGDGTVQDITSNWSYNRSHVYAEKGDYTVVFTDNSNGVISHVYFRRTAPKSYPIAVKIGANAVYLNFEYSIALLKYIEFNSGYFFENNGRFSATMLHRIDFLSDYKPTVIADDTFSACNSLDFSNLQDFFSEVTDVGKNAFANCFQMKKISLPKCTKLGTSTFSNCYNLEEIDLSSYEFIPNYCFASCNSLKNVNLSICTEISERAFQYCYSLKNANAPKCTKIGNSAFFQNQTLTEINAPQCTEVGSQGFSGCTNLVTANFAEECSFGNNAFSYCQSLIPAPDGTYP